MLWEHLPMSADTLSAVLRAVRLTGALFFDVAAREPWVAEAPPAKLLGPSILPGVEHVIEYHVVAMGRCFGGLVDGPSVELATGDILVFPQGDAHVIASAPGMRGSPEAQQMRRTEGQPLPVRLQMGDGGPMDANLICGFLGCDASPFNPLLVTLPRMLHVRSQSLGPVLANFVSLALAESKNHRPGGECVTARLSELMFIEVVRHYVSELPEGKTGWLAGLRDELVGRALAKLHERPAYPWTLDGLANEVAMSRSMLAERFMHFVGTPPIQYLTSWRLQLAAGMLTNTHLTLAEIANQVGYGSEAALSRAFKRLVGIAPASWRQGRRATIAS
jgi:AraC-like DNA-binding protein